MFYINNVLYQLKQVSPSLQLIRFPKVNTLLTLKMPRALQKYTISDSAKDSEFYLSFSVIFFLLVKPISTFLVAPSISVALWHPLNNTWQRLYVKLVKMLLNPTVRLWLQYNVSVSELDEDSDEVGSKWSLEEDETYMTFFTAGVFTSWLDQTFTLSICLMITEYRNV